MLDKDERSASGSASRARAASSKSPTWRSSGSGGRQTITPGPAGARSIASRNRSAKRIPGQCDDMPAPGRRERPAIDDEAEGARSKSW